MLLRLLLATVSALLALSTPAFGASAHVVGPGETLWSIAAANNFTTRTLAAFNGLSESSQVVLGSTIRIPTVAEAQASPAVQAVVGGGPPAAASAQPAPAATPPPAGAYTVRLGDTLSAIAARAGVSIGAVAAMNGLDPAGALLAGTPLKLPAGTPPAAQPQPAPTVPPQADVPQPTNERVTAAQIGQVASVHGVSPSLGAAVAWQESGFNNALVSSANARGVMQILPGTWWWIERELNRAPLNPASATENVHAGVMYLRQLLRDTGGNEDLALGSYYQGLTSVRQRGFFGDTVQYVQSVKAHRARFGG